MDSLLFFNTQTMHISYTFAGFEPGTSDPEANVMSTAPRRQGNKGG
jgi:hypothetical protein